MEDNDKHFLKDFLLGAGGAICIWLFVICFVCSSCKILKNEKSNVKDSTVVNKSSEGSVKTDSSGTKTDKTNTKETVYYPQPIYIQGKDGETKTVFVPQYIKESGTEKTEQAQIITDTSWKDAFNSLAVLIASKESEKKIKAGFSLFEWIVIGVLVFFLLKSFAPSVLNFLTKK